MILTMLKLATVLRKLTENILQDEPKKLKLCQKNRRSTSDSFFEAIITLTLKPDKDTRKIYKPISLIETEIFQ